MSTILKPLLLGIIFFQSTHSVAFSSQSCAKIYALISLIMGTSYHHAYYGKPLDDEFTYACVKEIKQRMGMPSAREVPLFNFSAIGYQHFGIENLIASSNAIFIDHEWFKKLSPDQKRFLLAHELSHIYYKDVGYIASIYAAIMLLAGYNCYSIWQGNYSLINQVLLLGIITLVFPAYGRYTEQRADEHAVLTLATTQGGIECLNDWMKDQPVNEQGAWWQELFESHPSHMQRLSALELLSAKRGI